MIRIPGKRFRLTFAILSLLHAASLRAEDKTADVDKIFAWATADTPGCAVAVSQHGKTVVSRGYGLADLERSVPITPQTVFDAGSLTKQFVAASVLLLEEEGSLALSDDVRKHVPELPDYGTKVTIDHLLTHTSGIRDWTGIEPLTRGDVDALAITLRQRALNFTPGEEWDYSNGGYVLLKEIVARKSGLSFGEFARRRLFEPLGMKSTSYRSDLRELIRNRALAYDKEKGVWKLAMLLDNDRGGGGALFTTATDLLLWNDALTHNRLGKSVSVRLQDPAQLKNGRKLGYARGLFLDTYRGAREVSHTGSAAGYKSWLGRYPDQKLSIAIVCNSGDDTNRTLFAHRIFELFTPDAAAADAESGPPPVLATDGSGADPNRWTGLFFHERTGEPLRLILDSGRLRVAGGPGLVATGTDRFRRWGANVQFRSQDRFELQFLSPDLLELQSMEGKRERYRRAQAVAPTAEQLRDFAGRFESDEIGTVFRVNPASGALSIELEHSPGKRMELKPVDRDVFQRGMMTIRFLRNDKGIVTGLEYSNPVVRKVRFSRLPDAAVPR